LVARPQRPVLRCSFCGLGEGEIARLFEGHSGYICDECVDVCVQLLHDYREMGIRPPKASQPWYKKLLGEDGVEVGQCSFNVHDRNNPQGGRLFAGINAQICDKCVRACEVLKSGLALGG
jgi:ATP-dependent protease Clp ATPase subunit